MQQKQRQLNEQLRAEKQNIVRVELEKKQALDAMTELKEDLAKAKGNEKRLKQELDQEKLKSSNALQEALKKSQ